MEKLISGCISGCIVDEASGDPLVTPDVRLYQIGIVGETRASLDEYGRFSFQNLAEGQYRLGIYDQQHVTHYERFTLHENQNLQDLQISLTRGGFISGQILDEDSRPPERSWFTLLREGERNGRLGYVNASGDHKVAEDGTFCSPPLSSGQYLLRVAGIRREPLYEAASESSHHILQKRIFDFLYINADDVTTASSLSVQAGQNNPKLHVSIPRPIWHLVKGRVTGALPQERTKVSVMFARDFGSVDQIGGGIGAQVQPDGTFEHLAQQGRYFAEIC